MNRLIDLPPRKIQSTRDSTEFYFGVKASGIGQLPSGNEYIVVYSPKMGVGWHSIRYRAVGNGRLGVVIENRKLEPDEIIHFENLLITATHNTGTNGVGE